MTAAGTQEKVDATQVRRQLDRLLSDPHFSHSRRFPDFLRFVVHHTLAGQTETLKERTVGIEVFGKEADYDTGTDPIVRVTAAEIRKRIAQYYQEPGRESELRITLPSGSYVPKFDWPTTNLDTNATAKPGENLHGQTAADEGPQAEAQIDAVANGTDRAQTIRFRVIVAALICVSLALLAIGVNFAVHQARESAFNFFWRPILSSPDPVLVCIADQLQYSEISLRDAANPSHQVVLKDSLVAAIFDDLNAAVKVAGILQAADKRYSLKSEGVTGLEDLRAGPTIFIGAFDNAWTLRLTNSLRYHFANSPDMSQFRIVDSTNPGQNRWVVDRNVQIATNNYRDYAILARFTDVNTGKVAVIAAGIGRGGTIAAGEFLSNRELLDQLRRAARDAGNKTNMEVVISTEIIGGAPGSPRMEASYFW
ncbi:hypothetical protein [Terracidiphilus gabretensis]|uniref:hypothetical protein n=1 Tax=Terracidiphilus gabretensis TaxID=1577687 RepID=UPI0012FAA422|nr:hypothetical protein [Terracidiphilus gabretensis]